MGLHRKINRDVLSDESQIGFGEDDAPLDLKHEIPRFKRKSLNVANFSKPGEIGAKLNDQDVIDQFARYGLEAKSRQNLPLVHTMKFNAFMGVVIVINAFLMYFQTDACHEWVTIQLDGGVLEDFCKVYTNRLPYNDRLAWFVVDNVFTTIFLLELIARLVTDGRHFHQDTWNILDFILVTLAVMDTYIFPYLEEQPAPEVWIPPEERDPCYLSNWKMVMEVHGNDCNQEVSGGSILRIMSGFRTFRLLRLLRLVKDVPQFRELIMVANGLRETLLSLVWVFLLLLVILYVCAIMCVSGLGKWDDASFQVIPYEPQDAIEAIRIEERAFGEEKSRLRFDANGLDYPEILCTQGTDRIQRCVDGTGQLVYPTYGISMYCPYEQWEQDQCRQVKQYWGGVLPAMFTLFQVVTLDHWSTQIVRPLLKEKWAWSLFFLAFLMVTSFGLCNMIIGVVTENAVSMAKRNERERLSRSQKDLNRVGESVFAIFQATDADGSGVIDKAEFMKVINRKAVKQRLAVLDVPPTDINDLFKLLDADGSGCITLAEFFQGFMKLKGEAKGKDMITLSVSVQRSVEHTEFMQESVDRQNGEMDRVLDNLDELWIDYFCPKNERNKQWKDLEAKRQARIELARKEEEAERKRQIRAHEKAERKKMKLEHQRRMRQSVVQNIPEGDQRPNRPRRASQMIDAPAQPQRRINPDMV